MITVTTYSQMLSLTIDGERSLTGLELAITIAVVVVGVLAIALMYRAMKKG
jgi:hypothetical protein